MENPLGVCLSKGYQGTTRGKAKILMTSVGIEPTTSGLDLPLLSLVTWTRRQEHITPILRSLRWLPDHYRIVF